MSGPRRTASVVRIAAQLRGDPRTVALILVVPALLLTLLYFVFVDAPERPGAGPAFDSIGPIMLAVLPMMLLFIVTSVVMLRERTSGTLERIMTTPLRRLNLLASYALVFGLLAIAQSAILSALLLGPLGVPIAGPWWAFLVLAFLSAVVGVALGLLASAFARTEFQAVQFMPLVIGPQIFLCGLLVATDDMPVPLARISAVLPMTWAVDVVTDLVEHAGIGSGSALKMAALAVLAVVLLVVAAASMPRQAR